MNASSPTLPVTDLIDTLAGLTAGGATHLLRHRRDKVAHATQGSYEGLFDPDLPGMSLQERLLIALYACRLSKAESLAAHYRACLQALGSSDSGGAPTRSSPELLAVEGGSLAEILSLSNVRLRAMLNFTRTLILNPIEGDKAALQALPAAGITTPAVVTLAQLIAFLSYQIRLVSGLAAMQAAQQKRAKE